MKTRPETGRVPIIGVIGTVGVPACYGGFETLAEQLARHIRPSECEFIFYCQRSAYAEVRGEADNSFAGHRRFFIPLRANGPESMIHDAMAMLHGALVVKVDVLLILGYSGAWALPLLRLLRPEMRIITNIDGMEWRRDKFGALARRTLRLLEGFAARSSHRVIVDNFALVPLVRSLYPSLDPLLIAYGGDHTLVPEDVVPFELENSFYLSIARIEPENNCHLILEAFEASDNQFLVFIGNWGASSYGVNLKARYADHTRIRLLDPIYQQSVLAAIRAKAEGYVHGHSVGGTNPSLVEALFHTSRLLAFDCIFNRSTLEGHGAYFSTASQLCEHLKRPDRLEIPFSSVKQLRQRYRWGPIAKAYVDACS